MLAPLIAAIALLAQDTTRTYNGRAGQLDVAIPKIEAAVTVDGVLDEEAWSQAAVLTGFSLYMPVDQQPSPDSTEVRIWYSTDALYVGVRAFEPHGEVRATLADRDRLGSNDNVELHLDTFGDRRRAFVFIVNPFGVQADGTKTEGGGFIPGAAPPGENDLSPDFIWQSKGRLTPFGFEVELRIPFSSLRYRSRGPQTWGIQVVRNVQHSGYEETWTPARRASASFIAQAGRLIGLTGMHHGQVVELIPELTTGINGAPRADSSWGYTTDPALGGNIRWGIGSNFVLNGAVRPDFSQVEADALQIAGDARFDLFYAERRPFFVEGSEQFDVPNTLVYTRRIVLPSVATKVTGRLGQSDVAMLAAMDDPQASHTGTDPARVGIVRWKRDFLGQSTAGLLYSERTESAEYSNRVAEGDVHIVFGKLYFAQFQAVGSATRTGGGTHVAPMWNAVLDRTGRYWGFNYSLLGIAQDFAAWNGFVPRTGFVRPNIANRFTAYGKPGQVFERYNVFLTASSLWRYEDFFRGERVLESRVNADNTVTLRGGWTLGASPFAARYVFDPAAYAAYARSTSSGFVPFTPPDHASFAGVGVSVNTPQFRHFAASAGTSAGRDVDFTDATVIDRRDSRASVDWRPTTRVRMTASYLSSRFIRDNGDVAALTRIPRLRAEYQITRPLFVRFVGQYEARRRAAPRDPATGAPLWISTPSGYVQGTPSTTNDLRVDWLLSYRPTPGTVVFAGYGSSLSEEDPLAFQNLRRKNDGFFVKLSYRFRG